MQATNKEENNDCIIAENYFPNKTSVIIVTWKCL